MRFLWQSFRQHPLVRTLAGLHGNPRICVYTEPLWGIPYALYTPFFTIYMYALGVDDRQIGFLLTLSMFLQIWTTLLGGVLADKLGRRLTTVIFDTLSWSVPTLLWTFAQDYPWFLAAAVFNSFFQIPNNSWNSLLVEDAEDSDLVNIFTWVTVAGLVAVFFAPLSGIMVSRMGLIPAMRVLLGITFIMMTVKFAILFIFGKETRQGHVRMRETRGVPLGRLMAGYRHVASGMLREPRTLILLGMMTIHNITSTISGNFFSLLATQNLGVPEPWLAVYPMARAAVMLIFIFTIQHVLNRLDFRIPLALGLGLYLLSQFLLVAAPAGQPSFLFLYIISDAFAAALFVPQKDTMLTVFVDPHERSRVVSLLYVFMIGISAPFGWIAGSLSSVGRRLPFLLNIVLFALGLVLVWMARHERASRDLSALESAENGSLGKESGVKADILE